MNKIKVLNRKEITELLTSNNYELFVDTIYFKIYIIDKIQGDKVGAVRFNTYLQLDIKAFICMTGYSYNVYNYLGGDIWRY